MSQREAESLKQDNNEKARQIVLLRQSLSQNEEKVAALEEEVNEQRKKYSSLQEESRDAIDQARKETAASAQREYHSRVQSRDDAHSQSIAKIEGEYAQRASDLERHFKEQLELNPGYMAIVQDMRKKAEEDEASLLQQEEKLVKKQEEYRTSLEQLQQQRIDNAEEIKQEKNKLSDEFAKADASWAKSREMLNERLQRGQRDRANYTVYRNLYDEVGQAVHGVLDPVGLASNTLQMEADRWRADASRFRDWKKNENKLFDHMPKYRALGQAIVKFLENRASQADAAREQMMEMHERLRGSLSEMKEAGHDSRSLTRALHFDDDVPIQTTRLAYDIGHLHVHRDRQDELYEKIKQAKTKLENMEDSTATATLRYNVEEWTQERKMYDLLISTARSMNELQALEALLRGPTAEKLVYLNTRQPEMDLKQIVDGFWDIREDYQSTWLEERRTQVKDYMDMEQGMRRSLENLTSSVRQQALIELESGDMDEELERQKADGIIKKRMVDLASQIAKPAARKEPITRKNRIAAVKTATSKADLRRSLAPASTSSVQKVLSSNPTTQKGQQIRLRRLKAQSSLQALRSKLLATVSGDTDKLDEASKEKLLRAEKNLQGVNKALHKSGQRSAGNGAEAAESSKPDTKTETTASNKSDKQTGVAEKTSRRGRIGRQASTLGPRIVYAGERRLNISPSKPLHAHHGTYECDSWSSLHGVRPGRMERSSSWVTLPDEPQVRSTSSLAMARTPEESTEEIHLDSPQSDHHHRTPQSSFVMDASDTWTTSSQDMTSLDTPSDSQAESATAEADMLPALTYQISAKDYRTAATASPNSSAAWWSHKLYKDADGTSPKVLYCTSFETAEERAKLFLDKPVLGFDLEWEPKSSPANSPIKRCVSLIQIASEDNIGLFQIAMFKGDTAAELMPPTLRKILESEDVIKTGVNVAGDTRRMRQCLDVDMKGVMELSHLYRVVKFSAHDPKLVSFKLVALADQVQEILRLPLKKDDSRTSSWSRMLNGQQTHYAAADAYAGFRLFYTMEKQRKEMTPTPPRPAFFETMKPIVLGNGVVVERSAKRTPGVPVEKKTAEAAEGEEEEEFFDAEEELDAYELTPSDPSHAAAAANVPAAAQDKVDYPTLPQLTERPSNAQDAIEQADQKASSRIAPPQARPPTNEAVVLAETWISEYHTRNPQPKAKPSELRTYHLWHHQSLSLQAVASTLRDPPLAMTTVASYVLQAVKDEGLQYDVGRMKVVLEVLPKSVHGRYKGIVEKVRRWEKERGRE